MKLGNNETNYGSTRVHSSIFSRILVIHVLSRTFRSEAHRLFQTISSKVDIVLLKLLPATNRRRDSKHIDHSYRRCGDTAKALTHIIAWLRSTVAYRYLSLTRALDIV